MQESSLFGARFFSSCKIRALQGFCSHKPKSGFWRTLAGGTAIQVANKSQSAGISLPSASLSLSLAFSVSTAVLWLLLHLEATCWRLLLTSPGDDVWEPFAPWSVAHLSLSLAPLFLSSPSSHCVPRWTLFCNIST